MTYVLDLRAWMWAQLAPERLSPRAAALIDDPAQVPCLSAITLHQVLCLAADGRLRLEVPAEAWIRTSLARRPMSILPVTAEIALAAGQLTGFTPADLLDRFVVATALVHRVPLVTCDAAISRSGLVAVVW
ncbi:twitching motility protein PilT [Deltaproteobacteria bacterium]|nr:twitching motility protein PilT [Deltaproteobacteria bacterium]